MGVKSTREISRRELEDIFIDYKKLDTGKQHDCDSATLRRFRATATAMKDIELESTVKILNDKLNDREGIERYLIVTET